MSDYEEPKKSEYSPTLSPARPRTGGRKKSPRFSRELALRIVELASRGRTVHQISADLGVSVYALNNWRGAQAGFKEAVEASRKVADELIVASLFQRAVGWKQPAVKIVYDKERSAFQVYEYTEHFPADTAACVFWLKNRQRALWSDGFEYSGDVTARVSTGEIEALASRLEIILRDTQHGREASVAHGNAVTSATAAVTSAQGTELHPRRSLTSDGAQIPTPATQGLLKDESES